jgi:hypothetical protein
MRLFDGSLARMACGFLILSAHFAFTQTAEGAPKQDVAQVESLPDSPSVILAQAQNGAQQGSEASVSPGSAPQSQGIQPQATQPQAITPAPPATQQPQRPVGTAAAPAPVVTGITAAQPAGVAIAPGKQHRARSLVIKVGAVIGAGVAVGTVVALSAGTSSKPPGAH